MCRVLGYCAPHKHASAKLSPLRAGVGEVAAQQWHVLLRGRPAGAGRSARKSQQQIQTAYCSALAHRRPHQPANDTKPVTDRPMPCPATYPYSCDAAAARAGLGDLAAAARMVGMQLMPQGWSAADAAGLVCS